MERDETLLLFRDLAERLPEPGMKLPGLLEPAGAAIVEIAGRDSIAAALAHPRAGQLIPTIVYTGSEFGDPAVLLDSVAFLRDRLQGRSDLLEPVVLGSPRWWAAVNGRPSTVLFRRYGHSFTCVGCHMYLHALRVLLACRLGITTIVSGERERHGGRVKLNQGPPALQAYAEMARRYGVEMAFPLRRVDGEEELASLVGDWPEGRRQRGCVLSGNYLDSDGAVDEASATGPLQSYLDNYLLPVTYRILDSYLRDGRADASAIVEEVLARTGEDGHG
jgi:hypothetical protein